MANYGQLFAAALQRPSIEDTLSQARGMAQNITSIQKEQRVAPVIQALEQFANNYNTAATDEGRQTANSMANQIRDNFAAGGGSFTDLPTKYWGSNPAQGVQTTEGYQSPVSGYEGLSRKDTLTAIQNALSTALNQRIQLGALTGIDPATGQKTWDRQYQEHTLANRGSGSSGSSSGSGSSTGKTLTERQDAAFADAIDAVNLAASEGFSNEEIKANIDSQAADLIRMGIDPEKVKSYVDSKVLTKEALEEQKREEQKERLDARPFWQKTIDTVVPGAQYR